MSKAVAIELRRKEQALVFNSAELLEALFCPREFTLRYGVTECLYGYEAIAKFRATCAAMDLRRGVTNTTIMTYRGDVASVNAEFRRVCVQMTDRQSQVWLRTQQDWKIAAAHASR